MRKTWDIPAAWRGDELLQRDDFYHQIDATGAAELDSALSAARELGLSELNRNSFPLPKLGRLLQRLQHSLEHGSGVALLRGLSLEQYSDEEAARILYGLTSHVGTAVSQTMDGVLVFPVRDEGYGDSDPKARGPSSRKKLSYHTDRCDVISFLCVRQAKEGGENYVVSSVSLFNEILARRPDLAEVLQQPYRYQRHNVDLGNELPYYEQPVFSTCNGYFAASMLRVLIERAYSAPGAMPMTDLQREALDYVEELADDPRMHVVFRQEPGDFVLLNNWTTMHRRSEFVDHEQLERRRLLWRVWLSVPNSRPLDPSFAASYGATQAGALRGGMRKLN